jgi:hypothetical protein
MINFSSLVTIFSIFLLSCSESTDYYGKYTGILVMEDGTSEVELLLSPGGRASLTGFHETLLEGEWKTEIVSGSKVSGLWASFVLPTYRIRFELSSEVGGLRVQRISLRLKGKTVLRTLKLKAGKPMFKRQ